MSDPWRLALAMAQAQMQTMTAMTGAFLPARGGPDPAVGPADPAGDVDPSPVALARDASVLEPAADAGPGWINLGRSGGPPLRFKGWPLKTWRAGGAGGLIASLSLYGRAAGGFGLGLVLDHPGLGKDRTQWAELCADDGAAADWLEGLAEPARAGFLSESGRASTAAALDQRRLVEIALRRLEAVIGEALYDWPDSDQSADAGQG